MMDFKIEMKAVNQYMVEKDEIECDVLTKKVKRICKPLGFIFKKLRSSLAEDKKKK